MDFDSENIEDEIIEISENKTILKMSCPTSQYFKRDKQFDRQLDLNLIEIKEKVLEHLIPTLFFYKQKGISIQIDFIDVDAPDRETITETGVPDFDVKDFSIQGTINEIFKFRLYYKIYKNGSGLKAFHCANKRTVDEFSDHDLKVSLPVNYSGYFLLESDYFNEHVDNDRNEFDIFPLKVTDLFSPLSWDIINDRLKQVISKLIQDEIPKAIEINRTKLEDILIERPYLADYIAEEDLEIAGFIDKEQIIRRAKKRFESAKDDLLLHASKKEYTDEDLQKAIQVAQNELVSYIQDRCEIIKKLKTFLTDNEKIEEIIHNLFMERRTEDEKYSSITKNNLWLLDDRFTSYSYAASDKRINEILPKIGSEEHPLNEKNRPDIALFFSHNPIDKKGLKSVLIELKPFKKESQFDRNKFAGIQELIDYINAFKIEENIKEIWAFLVTDVDEKLESRLKIDGYKPLFSTDRAIFSRHYNEINTSIYVLGVHTLIIDAEARNKVFMDIINKQNRLKSLFKDNII